MTVNLAKYQPAEGDIFVAKVDADSMTEGGPPPWIEGLRDLLAPAELVVLVGEVDLFKLSDEQRNVLREVVCE